MSLFDLIEEHNRVGAPSNRFGKLTTFFASAKTCWARGVKSFIIAFPKPGAA